MQFDAVVFSMNGNYFDALLTEIPFDIFCEMSDDEYFDWLAMLCGV